jgi:hypothetical protein
MKINEIHVRADEIIFDTLIHISAAKAKLLYDTFQKATNNFVILSIDAFSPEDRNAYIEDIKELSIIIKENFTSDHQTYKIVEYLLNYLI